MIVFYLFFDKKNHHLMSYVSYAKNYSNNMTQNLQPFFIVNFLCNFVSYIRMPKDSSDKY